MSITCKSLDHIYGYNTPFEYYALKNVNLKIEKGSFTAIIGQTGSGKSTLIQHINALLLPTSGEIKIDDYIISQNNKPQNLKSLRKKSGLVFQFPEYQLFEETIERDIMFGPMNFGIDENSAKEIAKKSLEMVGLDYPGIGPEHAYLYDSGRAEYVAITDDEAVDAFEYLSRTEGIIPAIESAHAIAQVMKIAPKMKKDEIIIVCLSGRGDKDVAAMARYRGVKIND